MMCSIQSQAQLGYTPAEKKEEGVCTAIENIVRQEEQSLKSDVSRRAESDPLMAECKRLIVTWKKPDEAAAWYKKSLHGAWHKGMSEVADIALLYQWLNRSNIRANTETLIMAAQEQAPHTIAVACELHHTAQDHRCRLCKQQSETVAHIISICSKLTGTEYTKKNNNVASIVYRARCSEYNLVHSKDWQVKQKKVVRNDPLEISIQTAKHPLHNRPVIVLFNYKEQTGLIKVPRDDKIHDNKLEKIDKYQSLKIRLEPLWKVKIMVIPVVVCALGAIADKSPGWLAQISGTISKVQLQNALLRPAHVLWRVLRLPKLWQRPEYENNTTNGWVRKNSFCFTLTTTAAAAAAAIILFPSKIIAFIADVAVAVSSLYYSEYIKLKNTSKKFICGSLTVCLIFQVDLIFAIPLCKKRLLIVFFQTGVEYVDSPLAGDEDTTRRFGCDTIGNPYENNDKEWLDHASNVMTNVNSRYNNYTTLIIPVIYKQNIVFLISAEMNTAKEWQNQRTGYGQLEQLLLLPYFSFEDAMPADYLTQ